MKLGYCVETDSLCIELSARPSAETREVAEGVNIDLDGAGAIVGLDIDNGSRRIDLATIGAVAFPVKATRAV